MIRATRFKALNRALEKFDEGRTRVKEDKEIYKKAYEKEHRKQIIRSAKTEAREGKGNNNSVKKYFSDIKKRNNKEQQQKRKTLFTQ